MKLEVKYLELQTPMGLFAIVERGQGIEVLFKSPNDPKPRVVFNAADLLHSESLIEAELNALPERIPAFVDGPLWRKGSSPRVTISKEDFARAYKAYRAKGGSQSTELIMLGGGFSTQEIEELLGHSVQSEPGLALVEPPSGVTTKPGSEPETEVKSEGA